MNIEKFLDNLSKKAKERGEPLSEDDIRTIRNGLKEIDENRENKINRIKRQIEQKDYQIGSKLVADKLIGSEIYQRLIRLLLNCIDENDFIQNILVPLILRMDYSLIRKVEHHGPGELGKDLIFSQLNSFNRQIYTAVVCKAQQIHGDSTKQTGNVYTIINQVKTALSTPISRVGESTEIYIHNCLVVTSKDFTQDAYKILYHNVRNDTLLRGRVDALNGEDISQLCAKYSFVPAAALLLYNSELIMRQLEKV